MKLSLTDNEGLLIEIWNIKKGDLDYDVEDLDAEGEFDFYTNELDPEDIGNQIIRAINRGISRNLE